MTEGTGGSVVAVTKLVAVGRTAAFLLRCVWSFDGHPPDLKQPLHSHYSLHNSPPSDYSWGSNLIKGRCVRTAMLGLCASNALGLLTPLGALIFDTMSPIRLQLLQGPWLWLHRGQNERTLSTCWIVPDITVVAARVTQDKPVAKLRFRIPRARPPCSERQVYRHGT